MLAADNLTFRYWGGKPPVLANASIKVAPGEVVGLVGPSGSGKSTLAKLLAGYLAPQDGQVLLDELPLPRHGLCPVQLLFQTPELAVNPRWKIHEILSEMHGSRRSRWSALGIRDAWLDRFPHELSGVELQRVCIARSLGPGVRFLIADEISGMLDTITQAEIWQALLAYASAENIGILAISHDVKLLERIAQRLAALENGSTREVSIEIAGPGSG